jgi:hypothetical protein
MLPILIHISTSQVSSVMLRLNNLEIREKNENCEKVVG